MIRVAWRMFAQHPMRAAASFIALLYGTAVLAACAVLLESGLRYHGVPGFYRGSTLVVATTQLRLRDGGGGQSVSDYPLPEGAPVGAGLADRIAAVPGVRRVVADWTVPAQLITPGAGSAPGALMLSGHPWSAAVLTPFVLRAGGPPATGGQVVLGSVAARAADARPGQSVRLVVPSGVETFTVTGVAQSQGTDPEPAVFFTDGQAAALAGHPGQADVLGVMAAPGANGRALAAAVRAALPSHPPGAQGAFPGVYAGADRGLASPAVVNARELVIAVSATLGGFAVAIAIIVVSGTVGLSIQQRRRDIALLRAVAATPGQIRRMILLETFALAVLAGIGGAWAGLAPTGWLRDQLVSRGFVPQSFVLHRSWVPLVVAVGAMVVAALVAAWISGWRASRIPPSEALREAAVERRGGVASALRAGLGLAALAGGVALADVAANLTATAAAGTALGVVATFVIAVALLAPWLTRAVSAVVGVVLRRLGLPGRLAAANLAVSARALSPVVTALVLAVSLGGSMWFLQTSIQHAAANQARAGLIADQVITTAGPGLPPGLAPAARLAPGVAAATGIVHSTMFDNQGDTYTAQGLDATALPATLDLGTVKGSLEALYGATVAVDTTTAGDLHLRVGRQFHGWFGDGAPAVLRVTAIYQRGLGFANLTLPAGILRPHTATGLDSVVLVGDARGSTPGAVTQALNGVTTRQDPAAQVLPPDAYRATLNADIAQNTWTIHIFVVVLLVYVVIAALNALLMAALARRQEMAILRLAGLNKGQLLRMVRSEQAVLLGLALVVGGGIAALTLVPLVNGTTGSGHPYIPAANWATVIIGTVFVGMAGTLIPIRRILRASPIQTISRNE
jgi:putative ABC transport system permease protein